MNRFLPILNKAYLICIMASLMGCTKPEEAKSAQTDSPPAAQAEAAPPAAAPAVSQSQSSASEELDFRLDYPASPADEYLIVPNNNTMSVIPTPLGIYGVIGIYEIETRFTPVKVMVKYIYQSDPCDDLKCEYIGSELKEAKQNSDEIPNYKWDSGRVILKLDKPLDEMFKEIKGKYGDGYIGTDYYITLYSEKDEASRHRLMGIIR